MEVGSLCYGNLAYNRRTERHLDPLYSVKA